MNSEGRFESKAPLAARDREEALLNRCAAVARGEVIEAANQSEATVFQLASMILGRSLEDQARKLRSAGAKYFSGHPHEAMEPLQAVEKGWVIGLSRLRDMLTRKLQGHP